MSDIKWTEDLPVSQVRIARPTDKLDEVVRFYAEGIGLTRLGGFKGHQGYQGEMLGMPGTSYHLEFTHHENGSPCPAPTKDNLLVFYIPNVNVVNQIVERLRMMGYPAVPPENSYWEKDGVTVEDPDGWCVVLMTRAYGHE